MIGPSILDRSGLRHCFAGPESRVRTEDLRVALQLIIASPVGDMELSPLNCSGTAETTRPSILYVGDDKSVFGQIIERLLCRGCHVRVVETVTAAWRSIVQASPFAVVIDATQPSARWRPWELCRDLSECHRFLVVMVLAEGEEAATDRARAFEHGADRCFSLGPRLNEELIAYLAVERSRPGIYSMVSEFPAPRDGRVKIDWETRQVVRGSRRISLSPKEFALLQLLKTHSGHVVSKREIEKALWKRSHCPAAESNLKQVVKHLRSKIEADPQHPQYVVNIRGIGYRLQAGLTDGSGVHDR
jgi:DNA-binding response OmpR family regulator